MKSDHPHHLFHNVLVPSRIFSLYTCSGLLTHLPASTPAPLQSVQHAAAREIFQNYKSVHLTLLLKIFRRLPIMCMCSPTRPGSSLPNTASPAYLSHSSRSLELSYRSQNGSSTFSSQMLLRAVRSPWKTLFSRTFSGSLPHSNVFVQISPFPEAFPSPPS